MTTAGLFCILAFSFHKWQLRQAHLAVEEHAAIMSEAAWQLNEQAIKDYIRIFTESRSYRQMDVLLDSGGLDRTKISSYSIDAQEKTSGLLYVMPKANITADITYNGEQIGIVEAQWQDQRLFTYVMLAMILSLITIIINMWLRLLAHHRSLEFTIQERTLALQKESHSHQQTNIELKHAHKRFEQMFQSAPSMALVIHIPEGEIIEVNKAFIHTTGFTWEDIEGKTLQQLDIIESNIFKNSSSTCVSQAMPLKRTAQ